MQCKTADEYMIQEAYYISEDLGSALDFHLI
jgi:hypothetical protein